MTKKDSAEILYRAIGDIDDMFIHEAMAYKKKKKTIFGMSRASVVLTALVLVVAVSISMRLFSMTDGAPNAPTDSDTPNMSQTLTEMLSDASGRYYESKDEIDLFDKQIKFIYFDGEGYKTIKVYASTSSLKDNFSLDEKEDIPKTAERVWLSLGNGMILSPYLKFSDGNIGYNTLFEYDPEGVPSDTFMHFIYNSI